jgi:arginine/ornithine N-succinyltransferase beta subunit
VPAPLFYSLQISDVGEVGAKYTHPHSRNADVGDLPLRSRLLFLPLSEHSCFARSEIYLKGDPT